MYPLGGNFEQYKEAHKPAPRRVPGESPDLSARSGQLAIRFRIALGIFILLRYAGRPLAST